MSTPPSAGPSPAGYSGTPLPKKLGIKPGHRVAFVNEPEGFRAALGELPADVDVAADVHRDGTLEMALFFTTSESELRASFAELARSITPAGMLWISWPKKSSGVQTDLTEDVVRAVALENGMVDNKVCAIDAVWSGLKLVYRLKDRPAAKAKG